MIKKIALTTLLLNLTACGAGSGKGLDNQGLPVKDNSQTSSQNSSQISSKTSSLSSSQISSQTSSAQTSSQISSQSSSSAPMQNTGVTFASLQQNIFGAICVNCHTGSNAPRGLRLDSEENSYTFLVSRAADEVPELMRVNPGNPDASYIVRKLEGTSGIVGGRMPLGGPYLSQTQINTVRDWIANGAPRTGTGTQSTKISKVNAKQSDGEFALSLHFSRALQPDTVNENNISLYYATASSTQLTEITEFGLLILDQSIEIYLRQMPGDVAKFEILIRASNELPMLDTEHNDIELTAEKAEGGDYRYEYFVR